MSISKNRSDRDRAAYRENPNDLGTDRRVADLDAHDKLDAISAALGGATNTTPTIFNVSLPLAATEVSQALPASTKNFILRARGKSSVQIAYTVGQSGTTYVTIPPGGVYEDKNFYTSQTLYIQSNKAGETVELIAFT